MFLILSSILAARSCFAQVNTDLNKSFSFAILCGENVFDTGVGIEVGTPAINQRISFRVRANQNWMEAYKAKYDNWAKYETITLSMVYNTRLIERSRTYFDAGTFLLFPDQKFSDKKTIQGITSSIGLELLIVSDLHLTVCYYFAGGFNYINSYAEKLESKPRYGNGVVFNTGFRFYL